MSLELVVRAFTNIQNYMGVGKRYDPKCDVILILGGSSTLFGQALCNLFIHKYKTSVINLDNVDDSNLHSFDYYRFVRCDFTSRSSVIRAMKQVRKLNKRVTILINNIREGFCATKNDPIKECIDSFNANLINLMIITKRFLTEVVPKDRDIYIVNITTFETNKHMTSIVNSCYNLSQAGMVQFHDGLSSELHLREVNHGNSYKALLVYVPTNLECHTEKLAADLSTLMIEGRCGTEYIYGSTLNIETLRCFAHHFYDFYSICGQW